MSSILEICNNAFTVKAVGGDSNLGGDDCDLAMMAWAREQIQDKYGFDLLAESVPQAQQHRQRIKEAMEAAKITLSQQPNAVIDLPDCDGHAVRLELSLDEYNQLIAPLLRRTVDIMEQVLDDAGLRHDDIDRVILVGGATKNKAVRDVVTRALKEPSYRAGRRSGRTWCRAHGSQPVNAGRGFYTAGGDQCDPTVVGHWAIERQRAATPGISPDHPPPDRLSLYARLPGTP